MDVRKVRSLVKDLYDVVLYEEEFQYSLSSYCPGIVQESRRTANTRTQHDQRLRGYLNLLAEQELHFSNAEPIDENAVSTWGCPVSC
jgi:hypothetical protein